MGIFAFVIWFWDGPFDMDGNDPSFSIVWPNYNPREDTGAYTDSAEKCALYVMRLM